MKKTKRTVSVLLAATVLATALTGCGLLEKVPERVELSVIGEGSGSGELVSKGSGTYAAEAFDGIEVKGEALAIFISRSTGDQAEVELLMDSNISNKVTFSTEVKSGTLQLDVKENSRNIGNDQRGERKLLITLPEKTYDKLNVTNAFGRIDIRDVAAEQITAKIDAGQIVMEQVQGKLDIQTEAGEIKLSGIELTDDINAKSSVGTVSLGLAVQPEAAEISLSSELGKVSSDLAGLDVKEQSGSKLTGTLGSGGPKVTLKSEVGTVDLKVQQ
ncbi:DUF4097 family beta strand repeat-containing protein [Paenibacillus daejeonensis]|uniref:DUF4097 family beta strand repeat-containing protein n=1 Tax=Paenibacillus daejeonensis TaxID=135193 RepID=UPI0003784BDA|nr:DUF4097 family beta strand repeat-containing protein [Paenibacillus daejeonensis]